ncbi:MAG: flagellar biosynthesis protein FliQ [Clostridia bacterium]|jgi:flagellar biosynthetic protein FliQ
MTQGEILKVAQQAIYTGILVSAPMLGIGLLVGVLVSVFQATTQINEPTLAFIPKILAIMAALILFGPWILNTLIAFTGNLFNSINGFIN